MRAKTERNSGGNGVPTHLAAERFMSLTGTRMTHIPFKGAGPGVLALMAGDIDVAFGSSAATQGPAKAARVRALGISTAKRSQAWPQLPRLAESGVPGFEMTSWYALYPCAVTTRLPSNPRIHCPGGRPG